MFKWTFDSFDDLSLIFHNILVLWIAFLSEFFSLSELKRSMISKWQYQKAYGKKKFYTFNL